MVDGSGRRPPCRHPGRPHLPRRQSLAEEISGCGESLDWQRNLFLENLSRDLYDVFPPSIICHREIRMMFKVPNNYK